MVVLKIVSNSDLSQKSGLALLPDLHRPLFVIYSHLSLWKSKIFNLWLLCQVKSFSSPLSLVFSDTSSLPSTAGFSFLVSDGVQQTRPEWFTIERVRVRRTAILEANTKLNAAPGIPSVIAMDMLRANVANVSHLIKMFNKSLKWIQNTKFVWYKLSLKANFVVAYVMISRKFPAKIFQDKFSGWIHHALKNGLGNLVLN